MGVKVSEAARYSKHLNYTKRSGQTNNNNLQQYKLKETDDFKATKFDLDVIGVAGSGAVCCVRYSL
jgi:hypothetical protein